MRKHFEWLFDLFYLILIFICGIKTVQLAKGRTMFLIFGIMALLLGFGDLFHLFPRMKQLITGKVNEEALGLGKLITSLTSTIYYLLFYYGWYLLMEQERNLIVTIILWFFVSLRIVLCLLPQNQWFVKEEQCNWNIIRNLPFFIIGATIIGICTVTSNQNVMGGLPLYLIPTAVGLSFACYITVVLFGKRYPAVGMLMIPKTLMYVWIHIIILQII